MKLVTQPTEQYLISTSLDRACLAAHVATENKGRDVLVLDMRGITPIYDFFVTTFQVWKESLDFQFLPVIRTLNERAKISLSFDAIGFDASQLMAIEKLHPSDREPLLRVFVADSGSEALHY